MVLYVSFSRCGETRHRSRSRWRPVRRYLLVLVVLPEIFDEPGGIQVIRSEVVAPLRDTMRLVEHPPGYLPLGYSVPECSVAQLLRRHVQQGILTQPHPLQGVPPINHRLQPVQRCRQRRRLSLGVQRIDLILHQRLQRGYHNGQRAGLLVSRDRRQLETQRLPTPRRHDRQHRITVQYRSCDSRLQAVTVRSGRRRAEPPKPEIMAEQPVRVVIYAAEPAPHVPARHTTNLADESAGVAELMMHPPR